MTYRSKRSAFLSVTPILGLALDPSTLPKAGCFPASARSWSLAECTYKMRDKGWPKELLHSLQLYSPTLEGSGLQTLESFPVCFESQATAPSCASMARKTSLSCAAVQLPDSCLSYPHNAYEDKLERKGGSSENFSVVVAFFLITAAEVPVCSPWWGLHPKNPSPSQHWKADTLQPMFSHTHTHYGTMWGCRWRSMCRQACCRQTD